MKKITVWGLSLILAFLVMPTFAAKTADRAIVANASERPLPGSDNKIATPNIDQPAISRDSNVAGSYSFPLVITDAAGSNIFSVYKRLIKEEIIGDHIMFKVPADKRFILTALFATWENGYLAHFFVMEDSTKKFHIRFNHTSNPKNKYMDSINFYSGIVFSPGTNVIISPYKNTGDYLDITIAGYLTDFSPTITGDFDGDCDVDAIDLAKFAENYGKTECGITTE
jgi:hypothetical protein